VRGHGDLRLVAWGSLLCAAVALVLPWPAASLVFAAPLALALPGYAIVAAAFAKRELDPPLMAVLSVALSLSTLALGALLLNYAPGGIRGFSWAVLLLLVSLGGCRAAARRRDGKPAAIHLPRFRPQRLRLGLSLGGLAAAVVAVALASATLPAKHALGFTELWVLPVPDSGRSEAKVGVKSEEQEEIEFDLAIRIGTDQTVRRSFTLKPGEETSVAIGPPVAPAGTAVPVVATLLLDQDPTYVYRRVKGSLTATGTGP